jgi:hypothetical protein
MAYTLRKLFEETDFVLETSTDRAPHVGVNLVKRIPDEGEESLTYIAQTRSMVSLVKGKPPKRGFYTTIIRFLDTPDPLHNTPDFDMTPVRIRCSCLAFKFYFSYWNLKRGVLEGRPFPPYRRKTTWRPEKNPVHKAGMCKHLFQMTINLAQHGLLEPGHMMAHVRRRHHIKKKTLLHPVIHHKRKRGARRV